MKVSHYFSANWRKKDLDFLKNLGLAKNLKTGQGHFTVSNPELCEKIFEYFERPDGFLKKVKPDKYYSIPASVTFEPDEFKSAESYLLGFTGDSAGEPQPFSTYPHNTFAFECSACYSGKKQENNFQVGTIRLKKSQHNFILYDYDILFFRRDFFKKYLEPIGLKCRELLSYPSGNILKDFVQLIIPEAESKLDSQGYEFGKSEKCEECGNVQYGMQILDFFPQFTQQFPYEICKTQEEFGKGMRRIVVSEKFAKFLVEQKIVKYNQYQLTPVRP